MSRHGRGQGRGSFALEHFLPYRLSVLTNTVSRSLARRYGARFGVGVLEWRVIAVVGRFAPMSASDVCQRTAMDKVAVSRAVKQLVSRGLLRQARDREDLRRTRLSLSARGRQIHDRIVPLADGLEAELLSCLTGPEQRQLDRLLQKLMSSAGALDAASRAGP